MCTGIEIALVAGAVISAAVGAAGAVSSGMAAEAQADTEAQILAQRAAQERGRSAVEENEFRERNSRLMAARRALLGGTGVDPSQGSPLLVTEDVAGEIELQALRIRQGGEVSATRLEQEAMLKQRFGQSAATGGFVRGGSLLLTGVSEGYAGWKYPGGYTTQDDVE